MHTEKVRERERRNVNEFYMKSLLTKIDLPPKVCCVCKTTFGTQMHILPQSELCAKSVQGHPNKNKNLTIYIVFVEIKYLNL